MSAQLKRSLMAKIHIAKKDLALCDTAYRSLLQRVTGKSSCAGMSVTDLKKVAEEFKSLGWKPKKKNPKRAGTRKMATTAQASKIRAFWLSLYHLGEIKDPSEDALATFVRRMTKSHDISWLTPHQADTVIRSLRQWADRSGWYIPTVDRYHGAMTKASLIIRQCEVLGIQNWKEYLTDMGYDLYEIDRLAVHQMQFEEMDQIIEELGEKVRRQKQ